MLETLPTVNGGTLQLYHGTHNLAEIASPHQLRLEGFV